MLKSLSFLTPPLFLLLLLSSLPSPTHAQTDWALDFYTTSDCKAAQPQWARVYHNSFSGSDLGDCVGVTNPAADCSVLYSGTGNANVPGGVNEYPCDGPNGKGLSGAPLKSVEGFGSCDFFTDAHCSQGKVHRDFASRPGLFGPVSVCYPAKNVLSQKYFLSFKCNRPSS